MKKLSINITKAQLKSYTVTLEEGKPVVSATVDLLTEGGQQVTTYTASTRKYDWETTSDFELPMEAIIPIVDLAKVLEQAVVKKCRDSQMALGSGIEETDPISVDDVAALTLPAEVLDLTEDSDDYANPNTRDKDLKIDDKPIDLSEVPF